MRIVRSLGFLLVLGFVVALAMPTASQAQIAIGVSVRVGPPVLPVYVQPVCPGPGYIWTPGYWAYGDEGYYWVPGTWVMAPEPGLLWTPGYWGWGDGVYVWHAGYWGPHVGFYGGINYGYGYTGVGFWGGEWRGREFVYNRSVTNVNVTVIHNYYNKTVIVNNENRVSFNGGHGGIDARPNRDEMRYEHEHHMEARHEQIEHEHAARADRSFLASVNHGRPSVAATGRPGEFHGHGVVAAREDRRNDRPDAGHNGPENRNFGRNDRPTNAGNRDRAESRPAAVQSNDRPDPRGEARGNPHVDRAPEARGNPRGEAHGNARADDRAPEPHGNAHADRGGVQRSAPQENRPAHENKGEHGKEKP